MKNTITKQPTNQGTQGIRVFITHDLSIFKRNPYNRTLDKSHAKKIAAATKKQGTVLTAMLTPEGHILDGHHRVEAAKILQDSGYDKAVAVTVCPEAKPEDIWQYNQRFKGWGTKEFFTHYCKMGNEDYIYMYNRFKTDGWFKPKKDTSETFTGVNNLTTLLAFGAFKGLKGKAFTEEIKKGTAKFAEKRYTDRMNIIKDYEDYITDIRHRKFIRAITPIVNHKNYKHSRMLKMLSENPKKIDPSKYKQSGKLLSDICDIYNYHLHQNKIDKYNFASVRALAAQSL